MKKIIFFSLTLLLSLVLSSSGCNPQDAPEVGVEINGVIWATRNVAEPGKFAAKPEDPGMFYQWNIKKAWKVTDPLGETWNTTPPSNTWDPNNDPCPEGWRMPTRDDFDALVASAKTWDEVKKGRTFGDGTNTIFLPAVGWRDHGVTGSLAFVGVEGVYLSSTTALPSVVALLMTSTTLSVGNSNFLRGSSVRCVKK